MIFTDVAKRALLNGLASRINGSSAMAKLNLYSDANELLCQIDIDNNTIVVENTSLIFSPDGNFSVTKSGTITNGKLFADDGVLILDALSVGQSDADITLDNNVVQLGGLISVSSFVIKY